MSRKLEEILKAKDSYDKLHNELTNRVRSSRRVINAVLNKEFGNNVPWSSLPRNLKWVKWGLGYGTVVLDKEFYVASSLAEFYTSKPTDRIKLSEAVLNFDMWRVAKETRDAAREYKAEDKEKRNKTILANRDKMQQLKFTMVYLANKTDPFLLRDSLHKLKPMFEEYEV